MPAPDQLELSQRRLYRSLQAELKFLAISSSPEIRAYEKSFQRSLPRKIIAASKATLLRAVASARLVLVGDFHSFRQSQKGFLRLLADAHLQSARLAVALECVPQIHQSALDNFSAGLITAEELRDEMNFDKEWPFPWPNYQEIFDYCRRHALPLIALNLKKRGANQLQARDLAAAQKLAEVATALPHHKIFVLYGELHLGAKHLPAALAEVSSPSTRVLTVHQNESTIYWRAPLLKSGARAEVIKLRPNEFCVLNSVPWVKLKSYLDWIEGSEEDWGPDAGLHSLVIQFAGLLGETLGSELKILEKIEFLGPETFTAPAPVPRGLTAAEKILFRHARDFQRVHYLPVADFILLPSASTNAISEASSILLWRSNTTKAKVARSAGPRLVLGFLVGFLGSKILNPKRKCNEVRDMKIFLASKSRPPRQKPEAKKILVFRRALRIIDQILNGKSISGQALSPILEIEASRLAGYVIANRLFLSLVANPQLIPFVREVFSTAHATDAWATLQLRRIGRAVSTHRPKTTAKRDAY